MERAPAQPAPRTMPTGGELVFGLHDCEAGLAVGFDTVALHEVDEVLDDRRGRGDGIPGDDGDAGEHGAHGGCGVAVDDDLAAGGVHRLDDIGVLLGECALGVVEADADGVEVKLGRLDLLGKLLADGLFHPLHVDREQVCGDSHVDHVLDQLTQLGVCAGGGGELIEGDGVAGEVGAQIAELERLVVDDGRAGSEREHILARGLGVHGDEDVDVGLARNPSVFADANGVPGREAGDVGWEEVLAGDGHAHAKDAAQQNAVGGLRAGPVDGCNLD
jgi:hypothetical protein